jgi:hypothetical protein
MDKKHDFYANKIVQLITVFKIIKIHPIRTQNWPSSHVEFPNEIKSIQDYKKTTHVTSISSLVLVAPVVLEK